MKKLTYKFGSSSLIFTSLMASVSLKKITDPANTIIITDENIYDAHEKRFKNWNTMVLQAGEEFKIQATIDNIVQQLMLWKLTERQHW
jgi:3-dehydroquinate synthase